MAIGAQYCDICYVRPNRRGPFLLRPLRKGVQMMHLGKAQPEDPIGLCKIEPAYFANASVGLLGLPSQLRVPLEEVPLRLMANALFILKSWAVVLLFRRVFIRQSTCLASRNLRSLDGRSFRL